MHNKCCFKDLNPWVQRAILDFISKMNTVQRTKSDIS